jgi:hypothetical protein
MNLRELDLRNAQELMDDLAATTRLEDDGVYLALVDRPATKQRLLAVRRLEIPARIREWDRTISDVLYDEMHALPIPPRSPRLRAIVVTVIVRDGYNVWGPIEKAWALAWRYSNHNTDAFDRDIIVVTEHGWASLWSGAAGARPAAA